MLHFLSRGKKKNSTLAMGKEQKKKRKEGNERK
jgi:hypothetical protein